MLIFSYKLSAPPNTLPAIPGLSRWIPVGTGREFAPQNSSQHFSLSDRPTEVLYASVAVH